MILRSVGRSVKRQSHESAQLMGLFASRRECVCFLHNWDCMTPLVRGNYKIHGQLVVVVCRTPGQAPALNANASPGSGSAARSARKSRRNVRRSFKIRRLVVM